MVTVACWCSRSRAMGLPTMLDRPMTTARLPLSSMPLRLRISMPPAGRGGREELADAAGQQAQADRRDPVHVLGGSDLGLDGLLIDALGQRLLDHDAVNRLVPAQLAHQRLDLGLAGSRRQQVQRESHAGRLEGLLDLVGVADAGRILAGAHHGDGRCEAVLGLEGLHLGGDLAAHGGGQRLAVQYRCCHHSPLGRRRMPCSADAHGSRPA